MSFGAVENSDVPRPPPDDVWWKCYRVGDAIPGAFNIIAVKARTWFAARETAAVVFGVLQFAEFDGDTLDPIEQCDIESLPTYDGPHERVFVDLGVRTGVELAPSLSVWPLVGTVDACDELTTHMQETCEYDNTPNEVPL